VPPRHEWATRWRAVPKEEHHGCVWKLASEAASQVVPDRNSVHDRADVATAIEDGPRRHSEDFTVVDPHVVSQEPSERVANERHLVEPP